MVKPVAVSHDTDIPIGHFDDGDSIAQVTSALARLHGPEYSFAAGHWDGDMVVVPKSRRTTYRFIVRTQQATIALKSGDEVRGAPISNSYQHQEDAMAVVTAPCEEQLWAGDVICVDGGSQKLALIHGRGIYFEVETTATDYRPPRLVLLRHLLDRPGGCAAYPGAFRREALPPRRPQPGAVDRRWVNRVNEHTLDMRIDRQPGPVPHYHGPVAVGPGRRFVNHSETAIVLPRALYGLDEMTSEEQGHILVYPNPLETHPI